MHEDGSEESYFIKVCVFRAVASGVSSSVSLFKQFDFTERYKLEIRFEGFNITNTPTWGVPDRNILDPNFNVISSTVSTARKLQLGAKFYF